MIKKYYDKIHEAMRYRTFSVWKKKALQRGEWRNFVHQEVNVFEKERFK